MVRIGQTIRVVGQKRWTLFDDGTKNTYVAPSVAKLLKSSSTPRPIRTRLGGEITESNTEAVLHAEVAGRSISTLAFVIDDIGRDEDGNLIEILFGALAMKQWGIRPVPDENRLDLSNYPEVFVEF